MGSMEGSLHHLVGTLIKSATVSDLSTTCKITFALGRADH